VTTSIGLIVRPTGAAKVFAEVGDAVRWVCEPAAEATPPEELQAAYDGLRARMAQARP
jgi:hypothetical protein